MPKSPCTRRRSAPVAVRRARPARPLARCVVWRPADLHRQLVADQRVQLGEAAAAVGPNLPQHRLPCAGTLITACGGRWQRVAAPGGEAPASRSGRQRQAASRLPAHRASVPARCSQDGVGCAHSAAGPFGAAPQSSAMSPSATRAASRSLRAASAASSSRRPISAVSASTAASLLWGQIFRS
jgi:hypothetical protein